MVRRLGLVAVAVTLLASASASAASYWSVPDTLTAIRVADAHWPGSPCRNREVIDWGFSQRDIVGMAFTYCTVGINWREIRDDTPGSHSPIDPHGLVMLCTILEHEFGHLAGYYSPVGYLNPDGTRDHMHSPNRFSVMWPITTPVDFQPDCKAALGVPRVTRSSSHHGRD